jgi:hypothetical protein
MTPDQLVMRAVRKLDRGDGFEMLTTDELHALADNEGTKHLVQGVRLPPKQVTWVIPILVEISIEIGDPRIDPYDGTIRYDD